MATVKKGAKIDFYKFVSPKASGVSSSNLSKSNAALTKTLQVQTQAINNLGATVNSIGKVLVSLKAAQLKLLEMDQKAIRESFRPEFIKQKPIKSKTFDSLFKGKIPGFWESLLSLAGALLKYFLVLPALKWLSNPENQDKVVSGLKILAKVFKFIADVAKFSFVNTVEGLYDLLKEDATWMERIGGLGRALTGIGAGLLALRWLTNPGNIIKDAKTALILMKTSISKAIGLLRAHPLLAGAAIAGVAVLATGSAAGKGSSLTSAMDAEGKLPGDEGYNNETAGTVTVETLEKLGLLDLAEDRKKELGMSIGGPLQGFAKGGWISGPQSGYPVSISGGSRPDFIGHGTEYVARKADGGAFIVPFNTPATKQNPGLTQSRIAEARMSGFKLPGFSGGGSYDTFAREMIKEHEGLRLNRYSDSKSYPTIGYGHLIRPSDNIPNSISRAFAERLFNKDYEHHAGAASKIPGFDGASPQQKAALIDLTFNMGPGWYKDFPRMMAAFKRGDYETAGRELKDSQYYREVGRRGPTIVALIQNKGLVGVGQYLKSKGIIPPTQQQSRQMQMGSGYSGYDFTQGFGFGNLFGSSDVDEHARDGGNTATRSVSPRVVPASHGDTGSGWGIHGQTDRYGRPLVFSQPAAEAFARMIRDSKGVVKGADVASSGRSAKKNSAVGGHPNSVHMYGEGLDISGSSLNWLKANSSRYGWKLGYQHGVGSGHFDYKGPGSRKTPMLGRAGSAPAPYKTPVVREQGGGSPRGSIFGSNFNSGFDIGTLFRSIRGNNNQSRYSGSESSFLSDAFDSDFASNLFGSAPGGYTANVSMSSSFGSRSRRSKTDYAEQQRIRAVTEQRNQARREINAKTSEIVQMALAAVESQNGSNRSFIQTAEAGIRQILGAQAGGGTFANVGGTTGTVLRTAVAVLNSFNNPLRGIFS